MGVIYLICTKQSGKSSIMVDQSSALMVAPFTNKHIETIGKMSKKIIINGWCFQTNNFLDIANNNGNGLFYIVNIWPSKNELGQT